MFTTDLVNLYNRNIFKTSLYMYIFLDEKCRLMRNLSLSMVISLSNFLDILDSCLYLKCSQPTQLIYIIGISLKHLCTCTSFKMKNVVSSLSMVISLSNFWDILDSCLYLKCNLDLVKLIKKQIFNSYVQFLQIDNLFVPF